ncbi:guanylin family protein [Antennarius striatus]|uniref:guanylin family protein n=1 Tax=Antennarius striatus TaxID=241820 RepID=UPI0035AF4025
MKALSIAVLVLALSLTPEAVQVEENGSSFSLEAVQRLQELWRSRAGAAGQSPRLLATSVPLCEEPLLPQEFVPLCQQRGASASLARLAMVPMDVCEICSFAACTGC